MNEDAVGEGYIHFGDRIHYSWPVSPSAHFWLFHLPLHLLERLKFLQDNNSGNQFYGLITCIFYMFLIYILFTKLSNKLLGVIAIFKSAWLKDQEQGASLFYLNLAKNKIWNKHIWESWGTLLKRITKLRITCKFYTQ